jgi:peroxiredoxin
MVAGRTASRIGGRTAAQPRAARIGLSLLLALGIIGAAWFLGGQQGFDSIGKGGVNAQLLPKVGEPAPAFTARDLAGNLVSSTEFAGVPLWINFWGSWCPPCRAELPDIEAAYDQLQPRGMVMLAVSLDESTLDAALYAAQNDLKFVVLSDPDRSLTGDAYAIYNFPTHIFVDATGIVRSIVLAPMTTAQALENAEKALNPAP